MNTSHEPAPQTAAIERLARRRVQARMGWLTHATVYLAVIGGLSLLALLHQRHLPVGAAIGWGMALVIHGLRVLLGGSGLRERMVEAERRRLAARQDRPAA